jgi:ribosomal protein S18
MARPLQRNRQRPLMVALKRARHIALLPFAEIR